MDQNNKSIIIGMILLVAVAGLVSYWWFSQGQFKQAEQSAALNQKIKETEKETETDLTNLVSEDDFILGSEQAPVEVIEYASHFCIHCVNFHQKTLPLIMEKYVNTGRVKWIPRFLSPLEMNEAILCAGQDGYFWQYSNYLFEHRSEIKSIEQFKEIAVNLGLDGEKFKDCLDSKKYEQKAQQWFLQAQEAGVKGTPTFLINGQKLVGDQPLEVFERAIEQAETQKTAEP